MPPISTVPYFNQRFDHRRMGSSALSLCHVADGRIDALVSLYCASSDVIAGLLTVREGGGLATDWTDGATLLDQRAVAAATPGIASPSSSAPAASPCPEADPPPEPGPAVTATQGAARGRFLSMLRGRERCMARPRSPRLEMPASSDG
ncbi:inositol monophosphatase family protein [Marinimicrococcus flavescens]|uniref:Uncharacterized protein n=1 Tax=Marinimicrococcus flavescens TaxID=3031815 RepID=A0AAP3XSH0_9PROT|nr:hypothetical protein [Marinimicrococcus flavescens]